MKRWYITQKRTREANGTEREERGLPWCSSHRSPPVYVEWTEYLNVLSREWHLEHLFATAFKSKDTAIRGLGLLRDKIEYDVVTLTMTGRHREADKIDLITDAEASKVPKKWPKDRRKHPERIFGNRNRWPYTKEKASGQLERR